jgi:hypothetical protein
MELTYEQKIARAKKAGDIAQGIINASLHISGIAREPVPNAKLLRKRIFPNRTLPHVKKRGLKHKAAQSQAMKMANIAIHGSMAAVEVFIKAQTSIPFYPKGTPDSGGMAIVGETGQELIVTPSKYSSFDEMFDAHRKERAQEVVDNPERYNYSEQISSFTKEQFDYLLNRKKP